jgi:hypothetical protein
MHPTRSQQLRTAVRASLLGIALLVGGQSLWAAEAEDPVTTALHMSLAKRIGYVRKWLDQGDFKSLAQSAVGLQTLASMLWARSDDAAWLAASDQLGAAISDLQSAASSNDTARCLAALGKLERAAAAAKALQPTGQPQATPRAAGGLRSVMLLMDGIRGDAKIDLIAGNVEDAKNSAYVLSELGRVVSNSSSGGGSSLKQWPALSAAFVEASLAAARSPASDAPTVRQLMKGISQRCDACHEMR